MANYSKNGIAQKITYQIYMITKGFEDIVKIKFLQNR